jgi:LPS-assembly protein
MINKFFKKKIFYLFFILLFSLITNQQNAKEILIYADQITYDQKNNIIARGKAKILYDNQIISSNLIIYSQTTGDVTLPIEFSLKDQRNNYYYGSSGTFESNFEFGNIKDVKVMLEDGSRIVGTSIKREGNIDIISKGVYSPCNSKIKISNFLCPIWQIESEKMLHDYDTLFLYQKHSKLRVFNLPVFYSPYLLTPSPLRKERKSGFLTPSVNLNFFDTKISQSTSFPYYFNLSQDKELTFTPILNYGGGINSSQRFNFDYNQILSGGNLNTNLTFDTTFEVKNSEKWFKEGSLVNNYNKNINEKFNINFTSALETSKNYIQQTDPNSDLSYSSSLNTSLDIYGYNLNKIDDKLRIKLTNYQSNQRGEDNSTLPIIFPYVEYYTGNKYIKNLQYSNNLEFYNITRNNTTDIHSKRQTKLSSLVNINKEAIKYATKISFETNIYNQFFNTEDKKINNKYITSNYFRSFPIIGVTAETPFKIKNLKNDLTYTPKLKLVIAPGISNSNKLSNEDSSISSYTIENNSNLNRFSGTDKLDNSKRLDLSLNIKNKILNGTLWAAYEFTNNSNYHYMQGNEKKLSDLLGDLSLNKETYDTSYNFRFDLHDNYMKNQNIYFSYKNILGDYKLGYLDEKIKNEGTILSDSETLNYEFASNKIFKYSTISYKGLYDLKKSINTESGISYSYFDECFGLNIDFKRNSYSEGTLKPQDIMTVMFSFKNLGSYQSSNLAVSENDKQDIKWESISLNNDLFN